MWVSCLLLSRPGSSHPSLLSHFDSISFQVIEQDAFQGDFAGQAVLPVASLRPGFRCVSLFDKKGKPLVTSSANEEPSGPRLLCHFEMVWPNGNPDYVAAQQPAGGYGSALAAFDAAALGLGGDMFGGPSTKQGSIEARVGGKVRFGGSADAPF